jgi:hypothetical protein
VRARAGRCKAEAKAVEEEAAAIIDAELRALLAGLMVEAQEEARLEVAMWQAAKVRAEANMRQAAAAKDAQLRALMGEGLTGITPHPALMCTGAV